jgi:signal transduction histidine kinase
MKILFAVLLTYLTLNYCCAQPISVTDYSLQNFTDENGLPQNSIRSIISDDQGFIWLATEAGLVRYDGNGFKVFDKKRLGISSERIYRFRRHANGDIYAFSDINRPVRILSGKAAKNPVYEVARDLDMVFLQNLVKLGYASPTLIRKELRDIAPDLHFGIQAGATHFYIFNKEKIFLFESGIVKATIPFKGQMEFVPTAGASESYLLKDGKKPPLNTQNFVVIGQELFYNVNSGGTRFIHITPAEQREMRLEGDIRTVLNFQQQQSAKVKIFSNPVNRQAIAYLSGNFYLITYSDKGRNLHTKLLLEKFDIEENNIESVYYNPNDRVLFLGSSTKGLFVVRRKAFNTSVSNKGERYENVFYAHLGLNDSSLITPNAAVFQTNKNSVSFVSGMATKEQFMKDMMLRDYNHNIWFRTGNTINQFDVRENRISKRWLPGKEPSRIYQGLDSTIWVGFKYGGVAQLNQDNSLVAKTDVFTQVTFLYQSQRDKLWIGTQKGLFVYNTITLKRQVIGTLSEKNIRSITTTGKYTWITTYGDGIFVHKDDQVFQIPSDANGYLNYAHCMIEDRQGHFWIPTNKGLFEIPKNDLISYTDGKRDNVFFRYYDKSDGFLTNEFNGGCQPCGVRLGNGYISLPSMNGLVWFKPEKSEKASLSNPFILENVKLDGDSIPLKDTVSLPFNYSLLNVELAASFFLNRNNLIFSYSLKPKGDNSPTKWLPVGENLMLNIYNLRHGEYTLTVRKTTGFGNQYIEKKLLLVIATPWYRQFWFLALATIIVAVLLWTYNRWRTRSLIESNRILSSRVQERTSELSEALQNLSFSEQSLSKQLQLQIRILAVIGHDLQSPLRYLDRHSHNLYQALQMGNTDSRLLELSQSISESTSRVSELASSLLNFMKSTLAKNGTIDTTLIDIEDIFRNKSLMFNKLAKENETRIIVDVENGILLQSNTVMLSIVIHNLLDNAVKSAWQDTITLSAKRIGSTTRLTVADSVGGVSEEIVDWFNSIESSDSDQLNSYPSSLGLGLIMVREISHLLSINISVDANEEATAFHLDFE